MRPHKVRYGLNACPENPDEFNEQVRTVCETYREAPTQYEQGVHTVCADEKSGIQALERKHPTLPVQLGHVERQEFEYIRHGTQTLIAGFEVATGQVVASSVGPTRNEADFAVHIARTVDLDPDAEWIFVTDRLNIHMSETLVRFVAERCGIDVDLGVKEKHSILFSTRTRAAFLQDPSHRIRFVYTPKHTSWLNQIELWFSILVRRLLKRTSCASAQELAQRILAFIEYFNRTMAKPFKWTYAGKPLQV